MPHDHSEEDVARSVSEDRRLVEMGIDPDGDPVDRMAEVEWLAKEWRRRLAEGTAEDLPRPKYIPPKKKVDPPSES